MPTYIKAGFWLESKEKFDHWLNLDKLIQKYSTGGIPDAPSDGLQYARQNGNWTQVITGISDAPSNGNFYARRNSSWNIITIDGSETKINGGSYISIGGSGTNSDPYTITYSGPIAASTFNALLQPFPNLNEVYSDKRFRMHDGATAGSSSFIVDYTSSGVIGSYLEQSFTLGPFGFALQINNASILQKYSNYKALQIDVNDGTGIKTLNLPVRNGTLATESAISGTFTNPTSITVVNGIITAIS